MNFLHYKVNADPENIIKVRLTGKANVRLLDTLNYYKYNAGKSYQSAGESTKGDLVNFRPPRKGQWHIVIDLTGQDSNVRASVEVERVSRDI